ncbi:PREDICTED: gamma-tubulin complex component 6 isoform X2 [Papilio xuthus]|uniref:Gamma-tubulin complex component 6 isoform X2 n=1 Tax=Papilio xuthus TaxID=66420 RepID=A0AAJ6ZI91_PAPXU|nr:PREDICTED: gamma-tubulin complex component 6 isoform X2 [Papilio xuthus]
MMDINCSNGVYELISELCRKTASSYTSRSRTSQTVLASKMRSLSYEIILKKSTLSIQNSRNEPTVDLLSYCFVAQHNASNVAEYKRSIELKNLINMINKTDFGDYKDHFQNVLRLLLCLQNTRKPDLETEMFQRPFSFGALDDMLPKPPRHAFGSPQPYSYYPSFIFELPFTIKKQAMVPDNEKSYTAYTVESFDSKSFIPEKTNSEVPGMHDIKSFMRPKSLRSYSSTGIESYTDNNILNIPKLTAPRDLEIPSTIGSLASNVKVSFPSSNTDCMVEEMYRADKNAVDIWEIATQIDKNVPANIWNIVSKMPLVNERQIIATSTREVALWKKVYKTELPHLKVINEKQFIRHIKYLIIGIETSSFPFREESNCFYMKENLVLEGISKERLKGYVSDLLVVGTYYKRLSQFAFNQTVDDNFQSKGLVHEAAREVIRRYLLDFRLLATEVYEDCKDMSEELNCMPTLLDILHHIEPLKYEIETIASIYKMIDSEIRTTIPHGAELMSYLFNEISLVTHKTTALILFNSLFTVCKVYFKFIERFIFEGELDDRFNEFFIKKDNQYVNSRSKRYWDKGFYITLSVAVPDFLRSLAKYILLCGKSLRLLKLCNPSDPLVVLISSDHPTVKCCASFEELERQQQVLDVYRTRCLFVSGEPVTFDQILLKKEAERKAFTEMASLKQAETMEKIVAERKRLAQLIIAEKQHSLRVLEAAMAEAKAAKNKAKQRERKRYELEEALEKATEEVDSKLKDDERNKIMEYYSKLNMEVEKSKLHTEWKIKRLQLDQSRIQLLSTEERNLKREKLELEHKRNGEIMEISIESLDLKSENTESEESENNQLEFKTPDSIRSMEMNDEVTNAMYNNQNEDNKKRTDNNNKTDIEDNCDNKKILDSQGNILNDNENNPDKRDFTTSSNIIGGKLDSVIDNKTFKNMREEALKNKQKVMCHEFCQTDDENNEMNLPIIQLTSVDEENNDLSAFSEAKRNKLKVLGTEFGINEKIKEHIEPRTDAQKEALINKRKVLGVEYNMPLENIHKKEPANVAQEEAVQNRNKILASEYNTRLIKISNQESCRKSKLTLNLKPFVESSEHLATTTGTITPGDFFPQLDLETPTTGDVPLDSGLTSDIFTPRSDGKDIDSAKNKSDKEYLTSEGFDFSIIVDEDTAVSEDTTDVAVEDTSDISPSKVLENSVINIKNKYSFYNFIDGSYNFDSFDPFGVKNLQNYSKNYFSNEMNNDVKQSFYTDPAIIMEEVKKKPFHNIFVSNFISGEETESKISTNNIATLTACLQRSVMLPLTYQLEVVNNSILTHFLVNLDMYEHLRSLKDYFFLMDGEFSRSICHNLFTKLTKTLNPQELLNFATLHNILDKALGSSISQNLSFTIAESPLSFQHSSPDVLQCLSLTYSVSWPLNIILSQEALLRYAKVFQFLVKMRRVFWVLSEDFESLKLSAKLSREHSRKLLRSPQYISIQIYRHVMASLIRALDNYIVTTCILTSWTEFESDLKKARTLDDLYECHVVYIKKVLFRCLLNNRSTPVMKLLNDIFTVILKFSRVLKAGEWQQKEFNGSFTHTNFIQLEELYHLFEKLAKYLHKVVTKLMECGYQRHLVELLTMVNLNGYYDPDKTKEDNTNATTN